MVKAMGCAHIALRKEPNKVGVGGLLQPFADEVKLFSEEHIPPSISNYLVYLWAPSFILGLSLLMWARIPSFFNMVSFNKRVLFFVWLRGWDLWAFSSWLEFNFNKYSLIGALRGVAQTVSYEVRFVLILFSPLALTLGYEWGTFLCFRKDFDLFYFFQLQL